jgi:hypothetical protein
MKGKLVCQWRQVCRKLVTGDSKHECDKRLRNSCNQKQPSDHYCYVAPLKPSKLSDKYMYVFFERSVHKTFKSVMGLLNIFQTTYVLGKCVLSVLPWVIWIPTVNNVENVPMCSG